MTQPTEELVKQIKEGTHPQFKLDEVVKCKCGEKAIWWKTGYLCPTITAYPCEFNKTTS